MLPFRPQHILFDLDGTLVDTAPDLTAALNHVMRHLGLAELPDADARLQVGKGAVALIRFGLERNDLRVSDREMVELHKIFLDHYGNNLSAKSQPRAGVFELLDKLAAMGIDLAVCTKKPEALAHALLRDLGLNTYFQVISGADGVRYAKPDRRHVELILGKINGRIDGAVFVGDTETDVLTAKNASIPSIIIGDGYSAIPPDELGADFVIDELLEILALFPG